MGSVRNAISEANNTALRHAAHTLKSSSALVGAQRFSDLCKDLERMGRDNLIAQAIPLLPTIEEMYEASCREIRAALAKVEELRSSVTTISSPVKEEQHIEPRLPAPSRTESLPLVLLVEDNPVNQQIAVNILEYLGYQVDIAENGRLGVEAFLRTPYTVVLMDCQMPEMDGYMATREIRKHEATSPSPQRRIPIIALTANIHPSDREQCLAAGMDDHLGKPYTQEQLQTVLQRWAPLSSPPLLTGNTLTM